jgi:hypothetical protein
MGKQEDRDMGKRKRSRDGEVRWGGKTMKEEGGGMWERRGIVIKMRRGEKSKKDGCGQRVSSNLVHRRRKVREAVAVECSRTALERPPG